MGNPPPITVHAGDCLDVLKTMPDASVDAVVTDPPAGIAFMGKDWDKDKGGRDAWVSWLTAVMTEARRVLKPGGHALVWALPRTSHWTATALEDAGLEIRDCVVHLFGSGFPKSLDIGKAIDKIAPRSSMFAAFAAHYGERRKALGLTHREICEAGGFYGKHNKGGASVNWEKGYGVPTRDQWAILSRMLGMPYEMWEPLISRAETEREVIGRDIRLNSPSGIVNTGHPATPVCRNITAPATDDAKRWDGWGTALKPGQEHWWLVRKPLEGTVAANVLAHGVGGLNVDGCRVGAGRWPANLVLTHSADCPEDGPCAGDCPVGELDGQSGTRTSGSRKAGTYGLMGYMGADPAPMPEVRGDSGGASRFFPVFRYQAKAPARERPRLPDGTAWPTVKPLGLMRWLVRLITPPGGLVLDPFGGTGTTAEACALEGFRCVLIESDPTALELTRVRLDKLNDPAA